MDNKEKVRHGSVLKPYSYYPCKILKHHKGVPLHWHNEIEIIYIKEGNAEFLVDSDKFFAEEGDVVIVSSEALHAVYPLNNDVSYDTLVFSMDLLDAMGNDRVSVECLSKISAGSLRIKPHLSKSDKDFSEISDSAKSIFACVKENCAEYDMLLKSEAFRLFFYLYKNGYVYKNTKNDRSDSSIVRRSIEFIENNFSENITIDKLASLSHLSKSCFMSSFKSAVGMGAIEYALEIRIKKACEMLTLSDKNVSEIAFDCGFKNLSNFNKHFKRITSVTPNEYRKIHKI